MNELPIVAIGGHIPIRATEGAAGLDLYARGEHIIIISQPCVVPCGVRVEIPKGHFGLILGRSGNAKDGMMVHPGTVDPDYRGEIKAVLYATTSDSFTIKAGDRIAQLVIIPFANLTPSPRATLSESDRGEYGFGSTGR